jgi:hypothetical protein
VRSYIIILEIIIISVISIGVILVAGGVASWLGYTRTTGILAAVGLLFIASQTWVILQQFPHQGFPFLIRWAAGIVTIVGLSAIALSAGGGGKLELNGWALLYYETSHLLAAFCLILMFGWVCHRTDSRFRKRSKYLKETSRSGVEDPWLD